MATDRLIGLHRQAAQAFFFFLLMGRQAVMGIVDPGPLPPLF